MYLMEHISVGVINVTNYTCMVIWFYLTLNAHNVCFVLCHKFKQGDNFVLFSL